MDDVLFDVRKLDEFGHVVLPRAIRLLLGWRAHDAVAISADLHTGEVTLRRAGAEDRGRGREAEDGE